MLKSHEKFHSANGRRLVLIIDDESVNRMLLGAILEKDYEILYAADGLEGLQKIRENRDTLSLVLLDLMMPRMSGMELLKILKEDAALQHIPVIVMTSDEAAEIESLGLGANDFISKPYPQQGVVLARVLRTIELSEDREIINSTERDPLTGLYNREYFYRYAEQFDQHHRELVMDALVVDINHFHMINERYGKTYGDDILRRIGEKLCEAVQDTGGIVCRREADTFMVYCPHGKDYKAILDNASIGLAGADSAVHNRVRLRMGVYPAVDKTIDIERRFDRAKMAADTVRNSFTRTIGTYDSTLHEQELYAEQLIEDFPRAIAEREFRVFYQPKFDVTPEIPVLASAEALVRWFHPTLGMISPGVFIPLFEDNGLIQALDFYVWQEAAEQIRDWKDRLGFAVPVSVNVSRIDMYDPRLLDTLQKILADNGLSPRELLLEITESAYTQDSEQIISTVNDLRALGFRIEMDDFGTGYSSLNMISALPIDALKLDMQFIRHAFRERRDTHMLEVIIDIAEYLDVPVIAEGVETEEQLQALKAMGCDLVQGFYFSPPVPADEYERFVIERKRQDPLPDVIRKHAVGVENHGDITFGKIAHALSSGYERIYYVDTENDHYAEFSAAGKYEDLQIEHSGADFFGDIARDFRRVIYGEDLERVSGAVRKEALLAALAGGQPFSMTYRLMVSGRPTFYNLKAVRAGTHDDHHIVIGVSNVDVQMQQAGKTGTEQHGEGAPLDFSSLARALSVDMESIYYVDMDTDAYREFVANSPYGELQLKITGSNFFEECRENIRQVVYEEDRKKILAALSKEQLLSILEKKGVFSVDYRLIISGKPVYYRMKVIPAQEIEERRIIIGVSNIEAQITEEQKLEAERQSGGAYEGIAKALAQDYFSIYYVNTDTDRFIEYSSNEEYAELGIEKRGEDFFNLSRKSILRAIYPEDRGKFLALYTKENILQELSRSGAFTTTYRLMFGGTPIYVNMKITPMEDKNDRHIVIGVSNIDAQKRREIELDAVREKANRDALTGVKSKHAFAEAEAMWNDRISRGTAGEFAVAVCDVNGLKEINDIRGHKAGDKYIQDAAREICDTFKHSPVYRIGGDEFVAILSGADYEHRGELIRTFRQENRERLENGGVIIACGISEADPANDPDIETVFERADAGMYENKKELKRTEVF